MEYPRSKLLLIAFILEGIMCIVALLVAKFLNINLFPLTENLLKDTIIGILAALPPFIIFVFALSKKAQRIPIIDSLRKTMITEVKAVFANLRFIDIIAISLIAGFSEEIFFRGILQAKFGLVIASIAFGLFHFITPAYIVITTIMGFYIGIIFHLSESLFIPIQLHAVYDIGALTYLKYGVEPGSDAEINI
jgi:membrane protease YdiL (CAAX protease family)